MGAALRLNREASPDREALANAPYYKPCGLEPIFNWQAIAKRRAHLQKRARKPQLVLAIYISSPYSYFQYLSGKENSRRNPSALATIRPVAAQSPGWHWRLPGITPYVFVCGARRSTTSPYALKILPAVPDPCDPKM